MARPTRGLLALAVAASLAACQATGVGPVRPAAKPAPPGSGAKAGAGLVGNSGNTVAPGPHTLIGLDGGSLIGLDGGSVVKVDGQTLIGLDGGSLVGNSGNTLIGQDGGSLIGQDGGSLIGQDGGSLIGQDGGSLIGQDGGSIKGSVRVPAGLVAAGAGNMRLLALGERPLAGVHVYLRHVDGRFFVDPAGKLISAVTDAQGRYDFKTYKAGRGLVVFVPSAKAGEEVRGLAALHPKDLKAGVEVGLASALTASWIYDKVLAGQADPAALLDKLPATLEAEARAKALAAVGNQLPPGLTALARQAFAAKLDQLRTADASLAETLRRVTAIMGRDLTKSGLGALGVPLSQPTDVGVGPDGSLYVVEYLSGVLRRFLPDGRDMILLGPGSPTEKQVGLLQPSALEVGPDGYLYVGSEMARAVFRVSPDGASATRFAGGGTATEITPGMAATDAAILRPGALAFDRDGFLLIGEDGTAKVAVKRVLRVSPAGKLEAFDAPWVALGYQPHPTGESPDALAVGPDGTWWCTEPERAEVFMRPPGGAWRSVVVGLKDGLTPHAYADMLALEDDAVLITTGDRGDTRNHAVMRIDAAGGITRWAGAGERGAADGPAAAATLNSPSGLARRPDGAVLVADRDNGLVRVIAPDADRTVGVVAGLRGGGRAIARDAALNTPGGLTLDARGRVVVTEVGVHAVRRLEGDELVTIAGGVAGRAPTDGPTPADRLLEPIGVAARGEDLIIAENGTQAIRKLRPDGMMETLAGGGKSVTGPEGVADARAVNLNELFGVAVGPAGQICFFELDHGSNVLGHIWRLTESGGLAPVAGAFTGDLDPAARDGRPATSVRLGRVGGLAFDPDGNLYFTDITAMQLLRVDPAGVLTVVAGLGMVETLGKALSGEAAREPAEMPAREAVLLMPTGVACDAAGNVYVAELGTRYGQAMVAQGPNGLGEGVPVIDGRIRVVGKDGRIRTIAGLGTTGDAAGVRNPAAIAVASDGRLIVVDNFTSQIKTLAR